jgi:hypothetical protein
LAKEQKAKGESREAKQPAENRGAKPPPPAQQPAPPASPAASAQPAPPSPQQAELAATVKEIETALFAVKFYPVAVNEQSKKEAVAKLEGIYSRGSDTVRQLLLYMLHEVIATSAELKVMHTYEYFKARNPAHDPQQLRISVYRAMFNYNTSIEGLIEVVKLLGRLKGSDDAAKLLTYHFSHMASTENEAFHMLRSAILEALGESDSQYALHALLEYARYTDNERTFNRIVSALVGWEDKIGNLKVQDPEKERLRGKLKEIITSDFGGSHYG